MTTTENKNVKVLEELKKEFTNETDISNIMEKFESSEDIYIETDEGDYRFIHEDIIDEVLKDELSADVYVLGCFQAWFISDILNIPVDSVEKIQKAEGFEALGELMLNHIDEVADKYASADGYGHHFSHYNHSEYYLSNGYYMFREN